MYAINTSDMSFGSISSFSSLPTHNYLRVKSIAANDICIYSGFFDSVYALSTMFSHRPGSNIRNGFSFSCNPLTLYDGKKKLITFVYELSLISFMLIYHCRCWRGMTKEGDLPRIIEQSPRSLIPFDQRKMLHRSEHRSEGKNQIILLTRFIEYFGDTYIFFFCFRRRRADYAYHWILKITTHLDNVCAD